MKKYITYEQFNELKTIEKSTWFDWSLKKGYANKIKDNWSGGINTVVESEMQMPNIGQMIEFLEEHIKYNGCFYYGTEDLDRAIEGLNFNIQWKEELCDALWERVKEVLNHELNH